MSRGGIGSGGAGGRGGVGPGFTGSARPAPPPMDWGDDEDPVSSSLDAEFEGGQWINGEFFYKAQRERRRMTKEEQLYGYDAAADEEFHAQQRQVQSKRPLPPGGIKFVLGATLQPESNAAQLEEQKQAKAAQQQQSQAAQTQAQAQAPPSKRDNAAAAAALQRSLKRPRRDGEGKSAPAEGEVGGEEDEDAAMKDAAEDGADAEGGPSFRELREKRQSAAAGSRRNRQAELDEAEEEERRMAGRGGGMGIGMGGLSLGAGNAQAAASSRITAALAAAAAPPARPAAPVKLDKDFAAFTKHGKGFGLRMLASLGYRPGDRLGKHGTGVVNPILPKLRPKDMGLGFGNFKETDHASYARNAQEEAEHQARQDEETKKKKAEKEAAAASAPPAKPGWKKDGGAKGAGGRKPKREYRTAADVVASDTQTVGGAAQPLLILDYRGGTAKLTSIDKVGTAGVDETAPQEAAPQMLPELQHNLRLLVSLSEEEIRKLDRARRESSLRAQQLRDQIAHLESAVESEERRLVSFQRMMLSVDAGVSAVQGVKRTSDASLERRVRLVARMLAGLLRDFPAEYTAFEVASRAMPMVYPLVKGVLHSWAPLDEPKQGEMPVLELVALFRPLLSAAGSAGTTSLYQQMLEELLLPRLRLELSNGAQFSVRRDAAKLLSLVHRLDAAAVLPESLQGSLVQLVYPALARAVAAWNPRADKEPVETWVLPYVPLLPEALRNKLYDALRLKLSIALQEWVALDASAATVLAPWATRFPRDAFENLVSRSVIPKLAAMLRAQLVINPAKQDLTAFNALLPWAKLLCAVPLPSDTSDTSSSARPPPATLVRNLLVSEFFPKWFSALHAWLSSPSADLEEVASWYSGWKSLFPPEILERRNDPPQVLQQCFTRGLDLMNQAAEELPVKPMYEAIVKWLQSPDTLAGGVQQQQAPTAASQLRPGLASHLAPGAERVVSSAAAQSAAYLSGEGDDASFLALVLQFASLHGLDFAPVVRQAGRSIVQGKQLYAFGHVHVYANKGVLYARDEAGPAGAEASWQPIALPDLLEKAKAGPPSKAAPTATGAAVARNDQSAAPASSEESGSRAAQQKPAAPAAADDVD